MEKLLWVILVTEEYKFSIKMVHLLKKLQLKKFSNSLFNTFKSIVVDNNDNIYVSTDTPDKNYLEYILFHLKMK